MGFCGGGTRKLHIQSRNGNVELMAISTPQCSSVLQCKAPYNTWTIKCDPTTDVGQLVQREVCDDNTFTKFCLKAPSWGLTFPDDMDVRTKARLIGLIVHVHFLYYQQYLNDM